MTKLSSPRHFQVICCYGRRGGDHAESWSSRMNPESSRSSSAVSRRRGSRVDGCGHGPAGLEQAGVERLRPRRPRSAASRARRAHRPPRAAARPARAARRDRLGPLRSADEAARLRARARATTWRSRSRSTSWSRGSERSCAQSHWNGDANIVAAGTLMLDLARRQAQHRRARRRSLGPRVPSPPPSRPSRRARSSAGSGCSSEVWGYHFDPGSNVVEVCVRRLRKKLGPDAPIETVRHAGYRLGRGVTAVELAWVAFAAREPRRDGALAELGDDPVPLHLGQPDARSTASGSGGRA